MDEHSGRLMGTFYTLNLDVTTASNEKRNNFRVNNTDFD